MGLYELEAIDNPNIITIAVNPKEYFEKKIIIKNLRVEKRYNTYDIPKLYSENHVFTRI